MNTDKNIDIISRELGIKPSQVEAVARLLADDATVPFIARYRKEATGSLDEVAVIAIRDRLQELADLDKRKETVIKSLTEQEKITPELEKAVMEAETLSKLEDIYLPYRPKRRTRGTIAKEKGLEPLADKIFSGNCSDPIALASEFIDPEKGVADADEALQGARDIIAERINEESRAREIMRSHFEKKASLSSKVTKAGEKDGAKYRDYFDWSESALKAPSHRILALLRGAEEGFLSVHFLPDEEESSALLESLFVKRNSPSAGQISLAAKESYKRLMAPSMETEIKNICKKKGDREAIKVFSENIKELLLSSPLGEKCVLALDPGLRTGSKLVVLSRQGDLLHNDTIYPLEPHNKKDESEKKIKSLCSKFSVEAIAIGNGTGGRELLTFCKGINLEGIIVTMVNESGASVYSASEIARKEFPDHDLTVRGAVSIGRRLMDPLAELVKIDPGSIGVGQYQHDVDQKELKKSLDDVVSLCVNAVGVEINTASGRLLQYVSGLSPRMADAIVKQRGESGPFKTRDELLKVPGIGPKGFEQAAGFLRIRESANPLDRSAVHPESYHIVEKMAADLSCSVKDLMEREDLRNKIVLTRYVSETTGIPTLTDIVNELAKPGRDPRKDFELFTFKDGVEKIEDLEKGMKLPGVVTNVTAFGAFVDIGVHQDGLVHISELSDNYVSNPHSVVKVNDKVNITVMEIDIARKRISLSMKQFPGEKIKSSQGELTENRRVPKQTKEKQKPNQNQNQVKKPDKPDKPEINSPFAGLKDIIK